MRRSEKERAGLFKPLSGWYNLICYRTIGVTQMTKRSILVSWIGHTDLLAMADDLGQAGKELLAAAKVYGKYGEKPGPLKTAVSRERFGEVHLLSNYPALVHKPFATWLGVKPIIHSVDLADPTEYTKLFEVSNIVLAQVTQQTRRGDRELCILLSPGTPAMAVVWVLLGASRYPAKFFQTYRGELREAKMPAHLFEGIVPDLIRDRDIAYSNLAAKSPQEVQGFEEIVGDSQAIREAVGRAQRAAFWDVSVLLQGESGTGKEMFAQAIHKASRRKEGPFRSVNCAAIPRELLESTLFGHVKGAFTGADKERLGMFSEADKGTLLLDEIGECEPQLQAKLLRVLQPPPGKAPCHRDFRPVGASKDESSDVRIIAATNRDLQHEIKAGRFREDLYYRLALITLRLPPLRERRADIPLLVDSLLGQINSDFSKQKSGYVHKRVSPTGMEFVKRYAWPGNVRQLYNALLQAAVMADGETLNRQDVMAAIGGARDDLDLSVLEQPLGNGFNLEEHLKSLQRHYLRRGMEEARGNKTQAARLLGIPHYQTLDAQLDRLKVEYQMD
jgi:DNA-binding NtrC family response regulator